MTAVAGGTKGTGSWLPGVEDASSFLDGLAALHPEYAAALRAVEAELWAQTAVDPVTLELCRLRIAQLLRCDGALAERTPAAVAAGLDEALVEVLPRWSTDDRFDAPTRAAIGYAEQLLVDAQGVTDDHAASVIAAIGEGGFHVLTYGCGLFETMQRARLVLGAGGDRP
ncbi:MAG: carboxymuconolactone decarboxylase family protein [Acidimicrobiia bacterium]